MKPKDLKRKDFTKDEWENNGYRCKTCGKKFKTAEALEKHLNS